MLLLLLLLGIAGVGKSHCKKFAQKWVKEGGETKWLGFWLSAENEESIRIDYLEVMKRFDIHPREDDGYLPTSELARRICEITLDISDFEWLFVFDSAPEGLINLEGPEVLLQWLVPIPLRDLVSEQSSSPRDLMRFAEKPALGM